RSPKATMSISLSINHSRLFTVCGTPNTTQPATGTDKESNLSPIDYAGQLRLRQDQRRPNAGRLPSVPTQSCSVLAPQAHRGCRLILRPCPPLPCRVCLRLRHPPSMLNPPPDCPP